MPKNRISYGKLEVQYVDPTTLFANPWNSNEVSIEDEQKLSTSLDRHDFVTPITVRELGSGKLQILGGEHRCQIAIRNMLNSVPIINLGTVSEARAREISTILNGKYGHDDPLKFMEIVDFIKLEDGFSLEDALPHDDFLLDKDFANEAISSVPTMSIDDLTDDDEEDAFIDRTENSRVTMRFSVTSEEASKIELLLKPIMKKHRFNDGHEYVNAGRALSVALIGSKE